MSCVHEPVRAMAISMVVSAGFLVLGTAPNAQKHTAPGAYPSSSVDALISAAQLFAPWLAPGSHFRVTESSPLRD